MKRIAKKPVREFVVVANGKEKVVTLDRWRAERVHRRCVLADMPGVTLTARPRSFGAR